MKMKWIILYCSATLCYFAMTCDTKRILFATYDAVKVQNSVLALFAVVHLS